MFNKLKNKKNKIVLITGGTKGIGKSITLEFLKQGAKVIALYTNDEKNAKKLLKSLKKEQKANLFLYKGSITDSKFLKTLFTDIKLKFKKLDILINNAGIHNDDLIISMPIEKWKTVIKTNIKGTYLTSLLAKDLLATKDLSHIINISSISGVYGRSGQTNYATSKGAIIGLTKLFAKIYAPLNINVNTIVPGLIETEMLSNLNKSKLDEILDLTNLKRLGTTTEIAKAVLFLCCDDASYINASTLTIDGGFIKWMLTPINPLSQAWE